ncbi:CitMHS family citrate-Mg2+:H+ or citrate-Ca2+:H+ symporter [Enterococcus sp. PF1-24]|uniref:CitMHS family transporter n=1 Tax=unclassified Enterococcus TaxID=2608891 RepID=UPI0024730E6E|nr:MULTISPECIES: citrate:proton symporter [unclassified Enterococcus]MDH6364678.1 CitMHS family citrate-Mg2+:H+ or citrate-Ca2+:H+ symporter [Enterococcus sp. PFB1-1]MDH6401846.1 CitMHS family citrate-Mg2+:H+ or citrate-Ca2+:H+ symporter [Enterococcus sp. PF1-24]
MLLVLALLMIVSFILLLSKNKLSIVGALSLVPLFFGVLVVLLTDANFTDLFQWITDALFYKVNVETGKVSMGVISPGLLILFAVMYFDLMLNVGLFDPLCEFFIKKAKGDPLKVTIATVLTATVVTMNGDTTTTIIICVAAFLELYKSLNMKLSYLAIILVTPIGIFNQLPWGGPTIAASTAMEVPINELFSALIPGLLCAEVFAIFLAYRLGKKERNRLGWSPESDGEIDHEMMEKMLDSIREKDPELKRPKLFWFNLVLTLGILYLLIQGVAHGAVLFMIGSAIVLTVNYRKVSIINERIDEIASDALAPALATFAAGIFSGILSGSGMASALAEGMTMIIPDGLGTHMAPIYAIISAPAITFLPQDAFYFGIAKVVSEVMEQYGITPIQAAVASMVGQAFRLVSPVIPALFMLTDSTEMNFVDFQKKYVRYCWPILIIYLIVYGLTGVLPF